MAHARTTNTRALIDIAVAACLGADTVETSEDYSLIPAEGAVLASAGLEKVVSDAVASGSLYRTAAELAANGAGLQTLVLVPRTYDDQLGRIWILDGWSLLRIYGEGADLRNARLRGAQLRGAQLNGADLQDADLYGADMEKARLSYADLTGADLAGSILFSASLQGANLTEAELCRADLRHADLRDAVCVRTAFRGADLWGTYMWEVDISQAFTEGADFTRSDYLNEKVARVS